MRRRLVSGYAYSSVRHRRPVLPWPICRTQLIRRRWEDGELAVLYQGPVHYTFETARKLAVVAKMAPPTKDHWSSEVRTKSNP